MIIIALLFDVVRDRILIAMFPYGACEIPVRPEFSSPKLFFYLGTSLEYFSCRNAFDRRYDFCHTVGWNGLHEKMHVVLIRAYLQEFHLIALLNFYAHVFQHFIHAWVKYRAPVFGRQYQMIYEYRNVMALVDILAHLKIVRRKRRGIQPEAIQLDPNFAEAYAYRGLAHYHQGDYDAAAEDYDKAVALWPNLTEAYYFRALLHGQLKEHRQAIADYTKAIELKPTFAEAYYFRALNYGAAGNYEAAIKDMKDAADLGYEPAKSFLKRPRVKPEWN